MRRASQKANATKLLTMKILDVAAPILLFTSFGLLLFFLVLIIVLEAAILRSVAKYATFKRAAQDVFLVNIISCAVGFLFMNWIDDTFYIILICLFATILIETLALFVVNRHQQKWKLFIGSVLMNLASYVVLIIFVRIA